MGEIENVTRQLVDIKKKYEELLVKYYDVKRQNDERAEIISDLLMVIEVDTKKLREQLEKRYIDDGK